MAKPIDPLYAALEALATTVAELQARVAKLERKKRRG
jgi:hypothetical protein